MELLEQCTGTWDVGSSSQSSQICLGSTARKSFIFLFLLAPEEGLFSNRNIALGNLFKYI